MKSKRDCIGVVLQTQVSSVKWENHMPWLGSNPCSSAYQTKSTINQTRIKAFCFHLQLDSLDWHTKLNHFEEPFQLFRNFLRLAAISYVGLALFLVCCRCLKKQSFFFFWRDLTEGTVTPKVPKSKREGRQDRRKATVLRTNIIPSG
jgi:hypothetical protein